MMWIDMVMVFLLSRILSYDNDKFEISNYINRNSIISHIYIEYQQMLFINFIFREYL